MARQAAPQYSRQHLAARHRLRRTRAQHGRLFRQRTAEGDRRRPRQDGRDLLPGELLDVVERGQARAARSAIRMSPGIAKAPTAGLPPACRCKMPRRSRARANSAPGKCRRLSCSRLGRVAVHRGLDRAAQIKQPLFDQDGHIADIGCRFPPILENARLPRQLARQARRPAPDRGLACPACHAASGFPRVSARPSPFACAKNARCRSSPRRAGR